MTFFLWAPTKPTLINIYEHFVLSLSFDLLFVERDGTGDDRKHNSGEDSKE
jgi:hypothetical protein